MTSYICLIISTFFFGTLANTQQELSIGYLLPRLIINKPYFISRSFSANSVEYQVQFSLTVPALFQALFQNLERSKNVDISVRIGKHDNKEILHIGDTISVDKNLDTESFFGTVQLDTGDYTIYITGNNEKNKAETTFTGALLLSLSEIMKSTPISAVLPNPTINIKNILESNISSSLLYHNTQSSSEEIYSVVFQVPPQSKYKMVTLHLIYPFYTGAISLRATIAEGSKFLCEGLSLMKSLDNQQYFGIYTIKGVELSLPLKQSSCIKLDIYKVGYKYMTHDDFIHAMAAINSRYPLTPINLIGSLN